MNARRTLATILFAGATLAAPVASKAAVFLSITVAPPALPIYEQPVCPGDGYIWTPGFWQWDPGAADYYWVPGTWVLAPQPGYLWTPGYWAFAGGVYGWHAGYWGPHIGFYGGVNYGFGYFGTGYEGGYWNGGHFFYNTAINHVNVTVIHNTYIHNVTVVNNTHVAFNGGPGGTMARPTGGEQAAFHENHVAPTGMQMQHASFAQQDRGQFASTNHGMPPAAAMARPAQSANAFHGNAMPSHAAGAPMGGNQDQRGFANGGGQPGGQRPQMQGGQPQQFNNNAARPPQPAQQPAPQNHTAPAPQPHGGGGHPGGHEHR